MIISMHYRKQEFCRQPKLTANICKADGKGFAVSSPTANLLSAHQSAVSCFAVSSISTDGNGFAVSLFVLADGKALAWAHMSAFCRQSALRFAVSRLKADGKAMTKWSLP